MKFALFLILTTLTVLSTAFGWSALLSDVRKRQDAGYALIALAVFLIISLVVIVELPTR